MSATDWNKPVACPGMPADVLASIHRLRRLTLVHSCIYYALGDNVVDDHQWQAWANELTNLQESFGRVIGFYDTVFADWDGSTGYHLPHRDPDVYNAAMKLLRNPFVTANRLPFTVNKFTIESQQLENSMPQLELKPLPKADQAANEQSAQPTPTVLGQPGVVETVAALIEAEGTDVNKLVAVYVKLRDKKSDLDNAAKEKTAPLGTAMTMIENSLLSRMLEQKVDSMKTAHGTPYISSKTSYTVADPQAYWTFILSEALNGIQLSDATRAGIVTKMLDSGALALMESRAAKSAVEQYIATKTAELQAETGDEKAAAETPPGLNYSAVKGVNIRKS